MVVVAFASVPHSFSQMVLFQLRIAQLEQLFNKQGQKGESQDASPLPFKRHGLRWAKALFCQTETEKVVIAAMSVWIIHPDPLWGHQAISPFH